MNRKIIIFILAVSFIFIGCGRYGKFTINHNRLYSESGGYYLCFKNFKDIRRFYQKKTGIKVPDKNYLFSCVRNLDGSKLFIVETDSKYNPTIQSCAVFENEEVKKIFCDLRFKMSKTGHIMKPYQISCLFEKLGYSIQDIPVKKLEIIEGDIVVCFNDDLTRIFITRSNNGNSSVITNEYNIPQKWYGYVSCSIVEYHPSGDELILYFGQDYPLKGRMYLLNTKNGEFHYISNSRWMCYFVKGGEYLKTRTDAMN